MNISPIFATALLLASQAAFAQTYEGASSDPDEILVGTSTVDGGPHTSGKAGITTALYQFGSYVDFDGLVSYGSTSNGVTLLSFPSSAPESHDNLGVFAFSQVSGADVWFGEWSDTGATGDSTHTVYYVGDNTGTTLPTGEASYTLAGIRNYASTGAVLSGYLDVDFSSGTVDGAIGSVKLGATINSATASFSGTATETAASLTGSTTGTFYGADAAAVAGIATFSNNQYDVAYGGTKN